MKCLVLLFIIGLLHHDATCTESIYMKRAEMEDQATSASGYAYQVHSGGPLRYTAIAGAPGGLNHFGYPPITLGRYTQELPLQLPLTTEYKPQTPLNVVPLNSYGLPAYPVAYPAPYSINPLPLLAANQGLASAGAVSDGSNFVKGGGSSYGAANQNSHGEQGSTGYKNLHGYDKGAQGQLANEAHKGYYSKEGGNKAGHQEVGGHYDKKEEAAKGVEGASFSRKSGHKKGSKTTGYHRVHHKDEYKKDHSFYDESDSRGHFNKYGDFDASQAGQKGAFEKGGSEEGAFQQAQHGAKGFSDKGRYVDQDSGFKGEQGKEAHYKDFQQYAKDGGQQGNKEQGYSEADSLRAYA